MQIDYLLQRLREIQKVIDTEERLKSELTLQLYDFQKKLTELNREQDEKP